MNFEKSFDFASKRYRIQIKNKNFLDFEPTFPEKRRKTRK